MADGNGHYNGRMQYLKDYFDSAKEEVKAEIHKVEAKVNGIDDIVKELRELKELFQKNSDRHYELLRIAFYALTIIALGSKLIEYLKGLH